MRERPTSFDNGDVLVVDDDTASRSGLADPALAYDYFKSMVSLSVATLGGILTLGETVFGSRIAPLQMGMAALPVAISGMLALQGQTDVMQLCLRIKPPLNSSRLALRLVPSLYGLGVGIFLAFLTISYVAPQKVGRMEARKAVMPGIVPSAGRSVEHQPR